MAFNLAGAFLFRFIWGENVMRDLTEKELKLTPDWAVKFDFFNGELIYMSDVVGNYEGKPLYRFLDAKHNIEEVGVEGDYDLCTRLIPSKPFDITKHEFSDPAWSINEIDVGQGYIDFYNHETCTDDGDADTHVLDKDDAIAIAKALGVTGEHLK